MSIFAISFIILGHVSSVGKLFIAVFVRLVFGCFQSNCQFTLEIWKKFKISLSPCRTIECSAAEGVTPRAHPDMEVKLSISSSRRISFASDFKDFDLEVEELEKQRDNPSYRRGTVTYLNSDSDDDDDVESNYVNSIWNNCNVEQADKVHSEQSWTTFIPNTKTRHKFSWEKKFTRTSIKLSLKFACFS